MMLGREPAERREAAYPSPFPNRLNLDLQRLAQGVLTMPFSEMAGMTI